MSTTMTSAHCVRGVALSLSACHSRSSSLSFRSAVSPFHTQLHTFTAASSTRAISRPVAVAVRASTATQFGSRSTAAEVTEGVNLDGQVIVITGASSGIGEETARVLALRGATVVLAVRNTEAGEQSKARIQEELAKARAKSGGGATAAAARLLVLPLDLASLSSVRQFAERFDALNLPLNTLINNAGVMMCPFLRTADGHELQFGTNHLGHFLLTNLLLPKLQSSGSASAPSRVVLLSSKAHTFTYGEGIRLQQLDAEDGYNPQQAYGQSKLANALHARELARRLKAENVPVTVNALHPGVIPTNLGRYFAPPGSPTFFVFSLMRPFLKTIPQGAATTCFVASNPSLSSISGAYFSDCQLTDPSDMAKDDALALQLWDASLALTE